MTRDFRNQLRRYNVERAWYLAEALAEAIAATARGVDSLARRLQPTRLQPKKRLAAP